MSIPAELLEYEGNSHQLSLYPRSYILPLKFLIPIFLFLWPTILWAQIPGIIAQTPPLAHALVNEGEILLGGRYSYSQIKNPPKKVDKISAETVTTTRETTFLAYGLNDTFAIAVSSDPTQVKIEGTIVENGEERNVSTQTNSNSSMFYIIPTLLKGEKNRLALIWGKGKSQFEDADDLETGDSFDIGMTGLVAEVFLTDSFSLIPWASWNYLLFDISPPEIATEIGEPDYGIEAIFYFGDFRISAGLLNQAFDTVNSSDDQETDDSNSKGSTSEENYSISFSVIF